jgi:hypothetical protein
MRHQAGDDAIHLGAERRNAYREGEGGEDQEEHIHAVAVGSIDEHRRDPAARKELWTMHLYAHRLRPSGVGSMSHQRLEHAMRNSPFIAGFLLAWGLAPSPLHAEAATGAPDAPGGQHGPDAGPHVLPLSMSLSFSDRPTALLEANGRLTVGGLSILARFEGQGVGSDQISLVDDPTGGAHRVLHYLLAAQRRDDPKARVEHYLRLVPMGQTCIIEFSIKLDAGFTPVDLKRPDGGSNWCILRQWHQSAPESPPVCLSVKPGTADILRWEGMFGNSKVDGVKHQVIDERQVEPGRWYDCRGQWNVMPERICTAEKTGCCIVQSNDHVLPQDLADHDTIIRYRGPIGYSARPGHEGDQMREQEGIYQGSHVGMGSHHGYSIDHVALYGPAPAKRDDGPHP